LGTVFFVHGTVVRDDGYQETLGRIKKGLADQNRHDLTVTGISWGEMTGVNITPDEIDQILPPAQAKGFGPTHKETEAERWAELFEDPLFELRLAAVREPAVSAIPVGVGGAKSIEDKLLQFDLTEKPPAGEVKLADLQAAARWLATDPDAAAVLNQAKEAVGDPNAPDLIGAVARAVVARTLALQRGELGRGPDALFLAAERAALVAEVETGLTEGVKGVGKWLGGLALRFAEARATSHGKSRRASLMGLVTPGVGDILLYQRRGQDIADALRKGIAEAEGDVYVVGHSLGVIMLVDIMSDKNPPSNVKKIVTVGSQSPFFLHADALRSLRPGLAGTKPFVPWLNVYDRNDFLSFCATRSFPNIPSITDLEVSSGASFPDSHGAYWRLGAVYKAISDFCRSP
jgi:hypothetical protein